MSLEGFMKQMQMTIPEQGGRMLRASGQGGSGPAGCAHQLLKEESVFFRGNHMIGCPYPSG